MRPTPLPDGELLEYTRTGPRTVPPQGPHIHRFTVHGDKIAEDAHWCGGRWPEALVKEIAAAGHRV